MVIAKGAARLDRGEFEASIKASAME